MTINKSTLNLRQFLLRQEVLQLYRKILRTVRQVPNKEDQRYFREWARKDFKDNKHQTDEYIIKALMKNGEAFLNELKQGLEMSR